MNFLPVTASRWKDLEALFGPRGAYSGCWCMWWRMPRAAFDAADKGKRKAGMKRIIQAGRVPGILAYDGKRPVGWAQIAPRSEQPVLGRSHVLGPIDDKPVWSLSCFFIDKEYRGTGLMAKLVKASAAYAKKKGARIVEGYPVEPKVFGGCEGFTGITSVFKRAGFREVARRRPRRPILRKFL